MLYFGLAVGIFLIAVGLSFFTENKKSSSDQE
jgi:CHASE3 domain sensor protein